jgi:hypothetical protein
LTFETLLNISSQSRQDEVNDGERFPAYAVSFVTLAFLLFSPKNYRASDTDFDLRLMFHRNSNFLAHHIHASIYLQLRDQELATARNA